MAEVDDYTGGGDHFRATITAAAFAGRSRIDQHRLVSEIFGAEINPVRDAIEDAIAQNRVILFMKGTPDAPACGFSARTVAALQATETPFAAVDVLPDPRIRQELSAISNWPTIPQLFVGGELIGGCDIVSEMYESGELAEALR
jgi:monothiol glutaredoxin